ncbi:MAG: hypothetical protein JNM17_30285 [Archangium sp.]|nr:hypothetical protein [Archangium sp.]
MPRFTAGSRIDIPAGLGSGRSGYRFTGGQIILSASDASRLNRALMTGGRRGGGYSIPATAFMGDAYYRALEEVIQRQKAERRKIDDANGVRFMTPKEQKGYERWLETRDTNRMSWAEYQREVLGSDENKPTRVTRGGVRSEAQARQFIEILRSRGEIHSLPATPVSAVNVPMNSRGAVDLNGPLPVLENHQTGSINLFWKSGQVFLYRQSFDVVGAVRWNWFQADPKRVAELMKLGPA